MNNNKKLCNTQKPLLHFLVQHKVYQVLHSHELLVRFFDFELAPVNKESVDVEQ